MNVRRLIDVFGPYAGDLTPVSRHLPQMASSFNHLIGQRERRWWDGNAEQFRIVSKAVRAARAIPAAPRPPGTSHSISSSALVRREGAIGNPMDFAAFRLIVSLKRDGCSTGRSAGFAPL